jgi:mannose-1-phosphate guanylyltransferase
MEKAWREKPKSALGIQRVQKMEEYKDADVAELDDMDKFVAIHPKPHTEAYPNAYRMRGTFILKKEILEYIPTDRYYEIGRDLLPDVIKKGKSFYAYECGDYSKGIDTEEKWKEVEGYLKEHNINFDDLVRSGHGS